MLPQMYLSNNVQEKNLLQWCLNTPGDNLAQVKTLCNVVLEAQDSNAQEQILNHVHNILRLFDTLPNFLFTTSEAKHDS